MTSDTDDLRALTRETQEIWNQKAEHWDAQMGEGNAFQRELVGPAAERLLAVQPGETIADIGCGNGVFTRRLAALGASVVASDFSAQFIARAQARKTEHDARITYHVVDATDEAQLLALGEGRFDAAVCNMALMDMTTIVPLAQALPRLLKPAGRFVFAVQHPCFNSNDTSLALEEVRTDHIARRYVVHMSNYLHLPPGKGAGMPGEPTPHYYFHRPLGELLGTFFAAGFVMDGIEEPAFGPDTVSTQPLSWVNFKDIPPVLVCRLRPGR